MPQTHLCLVAFEVDFSTFMPHNTVSLDHLDKTHTFYAEFIHRITSHQKGHGGFTWVFSYLLSLSVIPICFRFMAAWIFLRTSYFALHRRRKNGLEWQWIHYDIILIFGSANPLKQSKQHRFAGDLDLCVCKCMRIWAWVCNSHGFRPGDVFDPLRWIDLNQSVLILLCSFTYLFTYLFEHGRLSGVLWL